MGTRADFYVGLGVEAEWLGSIAWDGYKIPNEVMQAQDESDYRSAVRLFIASRDDGTTPDDGWPWPWDDSGTTDFAYMWTDEKVHIFDFGHAVDEIDDDYDDDAPKAPFPDMSGGKGVTFGPRSGIIVLGGPPDLP